MAFKPVDWINENIFNSKNTERAAGRQVDPKAYQYGGEPGGADEAANRYQQLGTDAQGRTATQAKPVGVNYGQANTDRAQGQQARQGQVSLAAIMANRATGGAPTIAQQQADRQMQQSMAQQTAMAGSARGAGGLAAAQRNAAFGSANAAADISGQAQIAAGQERRDDTNAAAGMYSNMRGGDLASQQQAAQQAQFRTQSAAQQGQFNAGMRDAQAGRNDQFQLGMTQAEQNVRNAQLTGGMNQQAQQSANDLGAQQINAQIAGQNAQMNKSTGEGLLGMAQSGAGIAAGALSKIPGLARGGRADGGRPYLVGEEGPELIVPKQDGYVLTHEQTQRALGHSPADTITGLFDRGHTQTRGTSLAQVLGGSGAAPSPDRSAAELLLSFGGNPRREDGGPVSAGGERDDVGAGLSLPSGPQDIPGYQPPMSTWGGSPVDANAFQWDAAQTQRARLQPYDDLSSRISDQRAGIDSTAARVNESVAGIDARDKDAIWQADYKDRHGQPLTRDEDDRATEARYRQSEDDKSKRADAKTKRKRSLADTLRENGAKMQNEAAGIDTAYHGGGGYIPPQLIPIAGARALGGPIEAGGLVPMTPMAPRRPDEAMPMMGPGSGAGATSYEVLNGSGGENVGASGKAMSDFATKYTKNPGASPGAFGGAREDGGPIEGGPAPKGYETKLSPDEERAFASWKATYAPQDSGEDYDYRGAFKAGATPGEDGHWVDTYKKPNHPTFSNESQYARGEDAAKAGRWNGDRFIPAKMWDATTRQFVVVPTQTPRETEKRTEPKYNYDASKPFGERFVPATVRQPTSFERTAPEKERAANRSEDAAKTNAQDAAQALATSPTIAAAGPAAAAGLANIITSLFERRQATRPMNDEDDEERKRRPAKRTLSSILQGAR